MASQITHIVYAKKIRETFLADRKIDEQKYYTGTVFPDIRYYGTVARELTHTENPTAKGMLKIENDFELGMYVHSFVDIEREKILETLGVYKEIGSTPNEYNAIKVVEDAITYKQIGDWVKYIDYLSLTLPEELNYVSEEIVKKWHTNLQLFFSQEPTWQEVLNFAERLVGNKPNSAEDVKLIVDKVMSSESLLSKVESVEIELLNKLKIK